MAMKQQRRKNASQSRKLAESLTILSAIGIPVDSMTERRKERVALALLAAANLEPDTPWIEAACWEGEGSWSLTTREIIRFWNKHYGENLSSGSYDDVRRKDL